MKKGKIERFYEKMKDIEIYSEVPKIVCIIAAIVLGLCIMLFLYPSIYGGLNQMFEYPKKEEYQNLKAEMINMIVDDRYIGEDRITDKQIQYTITYSKYSDKEEWTYCKIDMSKSNAEVEGTITKTEDGKLEMQISQKTEKEYRNYRILELVIGLVIVAVVIGVVLYVLYYLFFAILFLLKCIEKSLLLRKRT